MPWPYKDIPSFPVTPRKSSLSSLFLKQFSCKTQPMNHCKSQVSGSPTIIAVLSSDICRHKFLLDLFLDLHHQSNHRTQRTISPARWGMY